MGSETFQIEVLKNGRFIMEKGAWGTYLNGIYDEIAKAAKDLEMAYQERVMVEEQCRLQVHMLQENRTAMELIVSQYMYERLYGLGLALDTIESAAQSGDVQGYVKGNADLQRQLGYKVAFETLSDFDDLMASDTPLKL